MFGFAPYAALPYATLPEAEGARQCLRPVSDIAANGWTPSAGSDLFAMLDESPADDADYDRSPDNPTTEFMEVAFAAGATPPAGPRTLSTRLQAIGAPTRFVVDLRESAASVQSFTHDLVPKDGVAQFNDVVTGAITDYSDLRLRVTASAP